MKNGRLPLLHFCEGFRAIPRTAAGKLRSRFVDEVGHVAGRPASAPPRRFRASVTSQDTFFNRKLRLFGNISKTDSVTTTKFFWDVTRSLGRFVVVAGARATSSGEATAFFSEKFGFSAISPKSTTSRRRNFFLTSLALSVALSSLRARVRPLAAKPLRFFSEKIGFSAISRESMTSRQRNFLCDVTRVAAHRVVAFWSKSNPKKWPTLVINSFDAVGVT